MNPNVAQILVSDHISESRRQAAAARRRGAVRSTGHLPGTRVARRGVHWLARSA